MSRRSLGGVILPGARACRAPADLPTIVGLPRGGGGARLVPEALDLINLERAGVGLPGLGFDPRVGEAALMHCRDMVRNGFMGHPGSEGGISGDRLTAVGYEWSFAAENVAHGYWDAAGVMVGWMGSAGHRENILAGAAVVGAVARAGPEDAAYWAAVFAAPL